MHSTLGHRPAHENQSQHRPDLATQYVSTQKNHSDHLLHVWIILECGLGGVLHVFKLPLTGMVLGAFVVMYCFAKCGSNQGFSPRQLVFAASTVAMAKLILTPHAGPGAFLALGYQVIICGLCFSLLDKVLSVLISSIMIALCTAVHKILSWYILFGQSLIDAVEAWADWVNSLQSTISASSHLITIMYLGMMLCWGLMAALIILRYGRPLTQAVEALGLTSEKTTMATAKSSFRWYYLMIVIILGVLVAIVLHRSWLLVRIIVLLGLYHTMLLPLWRRYAGKLQPSAEQANIISEASRLAPTYIRAIKHWMQTAKRQ